MILIISPTGQARCLYSEAIDLAELGHLSIARGSHVEPDATGQWFADMSPVGGAKLGPFDRRSQALDAETAWLERNWLMPLSERVEA